MSKRPDKLAIARAELIEVLVEHGAALKSLDAAIRAYFNAARGQEG